MLLAYSFLLNNNYSLFYIIGFSSLDFKPKVSLIRNGKNIHINTTNWLEILQNRGQILEFFISGIKLPQIKFGNFNVGCNTDKLNNNRTIFIDNKDFPKNKIKINFEEFKNILCIKEFVQNTIKYFEVNAINVQKFYEKYVEISKKK